MDSATNTSNRVFSNNQIEFKDATYENPMKFPCLFQKEKDPMTFPGGLLNFP